jgi:hypothetical protein
LATVTLIGIALAVVLPSVADLGQAGRAAAGARRMAAAFQAMRWRAVARNRAHGLFFQRLAEGWVWYEVADGNGNDLRTAEVENGTDPILSGPHDLGDQDRLLRFGFPPRDAIPNIPPRGGNIRDLEDPVKFGRSNIVSFTPLGAASSGTLYLTDGRNELYGLVLFGPTVRVRVWRFDCRTGRWTL